MSPTATESMATVALGAVAADERLGRRQIHQRANRPARPLHRARLEHLGEREQKHHRRALGPLAERDRAGDGDHHQHVDVEAARDERRPRAARRLRAGQHDRRDVGQQPGDAAPRPRAAAPDQERGTPPDRRTSRSRQREAEAGRGSSCSSQARMPVWATASAIRESSASRRRTGSAGAGRPRRRRAPRAR